MPTILETTPMREHRIGRRQWLRGASTVALTTVGLTTAGSTSLAAPSALVAPSAGNAQTGDPEPGPELGATPTPGLPRVLLAGDSMIAGGLGLFLERELAKDFGYPVLRSGKSSSGLSRPDFFDWMKQAKAVVADFQPQATIVMFGGNDVQGQYVRRDRAAREANVPKWIRFTDEPAWSTEYARRVNEFCDIVAPAGEPIFWIGMPVMRPPTFHEKIKRVNVIYAEQLAKRPNATFIDIWALMSNGTGEYAHKIALGPGKEGKKPKRVRVRAGDGIHLSPAGAHVVADHVKAVVHGELTTLVPK